MLINEREMNGYNFVSIKLSQKEDKEILSKIMDKAEEDARKVNKKSPDGKVRREELIGYNNLGGCLAEEVVKTYIGKIAKENNIEVKIYSPPFTGHFEHRDIIVEVNGKIKTIEVRSSFQYRTTLQRVFEGAFSLIGNYITSYKRKEPEKDFYIQVIHRYVNPEIMDKIKEEIEAFIIGGGSKELFGKIGEKRFLKQEGAEYLVINPINKTKGVNALAKEILEIKTKSEVKQSTL